ncbi:leucyl/phenylalanyl-tRNA--protein transferase [Microlunatus speluncae]|uniref:leucyl/phenylalanyl-tRNA--protein transferase n=1 Tax=Microlunatus speluncae TaxID=2594267 RepID=UPI001266330C|nr:leucyl/phenylalanyl-tRNA--protein transferase [Microlunatus speluncae]
MQPSPFGPPADWPVDDLIGYSRGFDAGLVVAAYRSGVFPMPIGRGTMGWFSPLQRGVLPLDGLRVSRSLRKTIKRYELRLDTAFEEVLDRCADPSREGAWINREIRTVYTELHRAGLVHSVEAWTADGRLAGGLYGISVGGLFAGESMFHDEEIGRDASKAALVGLVAVLRSAGGAGRLLDAQWRTDHLATLGVVEIDRFGYLERLAVALRLDPPEWRTGPLDATLRHQDPATD